jgi:hypothetical protein
MAIRLVVQMDAVGEQGPGPGHAVLLEPLHQVLVKLRAGDLVVALRLRHMHVHAHVEPLDGRAAQRSIVFGPSVIDACSPNRAVIWSSPCLRHFLM